MYTLSLFNIKDRINVADRFTSGTFKVEVTRSHLAGYRTIRSLGIEHAVFGGIEQERKKTPSRRSDRNGSLPPNT